MKENEEINYEKFDIDESHMKPKITDQQLKQASQYRTKGRLPILAYYYMGNIEDNSNYVPTIWRSAQTKSGISGNRNRFDEDLLLDITKISKKKRLYIYDCRPYLSAVANKLKGAGYENKDHYHKINMEINIDVSTYDQNNTEVTLGKIQYQIMDYATSNIKQSLVMEIDLQNSAKMQINIDNLMTLKQDVQIEKITDQNALKLNNLTAEQLNDLKGKINERLMYLYGEKLETVLIGVVENVLSAASETPSAENATEKTTQEENDNTNQVAPENTTVPTQPQQQVTPSTMPQTPKQELRPQERTTSKKDTTSKKETQNQETTQPTQPVSQEENQETNQVSEESSTTQNEV